MLVVPCSGGVIVTKGTPARGPEDLDGKTIAVQTGSTCMQNAQKLKGVKAIKKFPQDTDARAALVNGHADAWNW